MNDLKFTHLHVHSEFSLLDATAKISELISGAKNLGMDSIAITDHGAMYGVIDFYKEAKKQGIKPILGCEVYIASGSRLDKSSSKNNFYYHLVLLAENNIGFSNLTKLVSHASLEGFYYKPRIDLELLEKYKEGLICLSACLGGPVAKNLLNVDYNKALEQAKIYNNLFGQGNFFLELQDHGMEKQKLVNKDILKISEELNIPLVCTNDIHYINPEDSKAHEVFLCLQTGKTILDEDRMQYGSDQLYLKSPQEMLEIFPYAKEALENTYKISERCNVEIEFNKYKLPKFLSEDLEENKNTFDYLKELCFSGLEKRYPLIEDNLIERLNYELNMIKEMGFVDYFLIVWDFIKYAKDNNIMVGPGRGSSAGSLVSYTLNITNVDPIKYNLIFERFLNPERISMPDIDMDFCYERRQEVIDYVTKKYGQDYVAQIITFGTLAARVAIRDTGRSLAIPYQQVDSIAKMIPMEIGITIEKALRMNPELKNIYDTNKEMKYLIDMSLRLEGLPRHKSTHAAGVIISDKPIDEYVPLSNNDGIITTQYPMNTLEELGLLKMDFLGLRTLTVIQNTLLEIKRIHKLDIDLDEIDYTDSKVFEMISEAKTDGVFQLESTGMKSFMRDLKPGSMEDIIAGISLYRPGPMDFIPNYIQGKNFPDKIVYLDKSLEPILKATYGCIVYQEQVMEIVRNLAGYSLGRSDLVRRAMSKKEIKIMNEERKNFIYGLGDEVPGCIKNGVSEEAAGKIFDQMSDFAKYAFPKSHAAAYAFVGYQTAWLKYYYPVEYMSALMTSIMDGSITKVAEYIAEAKKLDIDILPPNINESFENFSVSNNSIRFGLAALKNVGKPTIRSIIKEREKNGDFISLTEFLNRMEGKDLNRRGIESFIKSGALDSLNGKRSQYMNSYKQILDGITANRKRNIEGQLDLFSMTLNKQEIFEDNFTPIEEFPKRDILSMEKEVTGIYITGHPLSEYQNILNKYVTATSLELSRENSEKIKDGKNVVIGGIISSQSVKYTKNNKAMSFLTLEDLFGNIEIIVFSNIYEKYFGKLLEDIVIIVSGVVSSREDEDGKIICNKIMFINELENSNNTLWIKISEDCKENIGSVTEILLNHSGTTPVIVYDEKRKQKFKADEKFWVQENENLIFDLKKLLGDENVIIQ